MNRTGDIARASWANVLGCEIDEETNFFEAGGDSITAILTISEINAALGTSLSAPVLLDAENFRAFRELVEAECVETAPSAPAGDDTGRSPMTVTSLLQQRWFGLAKEQLGNVELFFEVTGELDPALFEVALTELCRRHAVLHSVYEPGEPPVQRHLPDWRPQPRIQNLEGRDETEVRAAVAAAVERSLRFFDIESEVPFELELLTISSNEHLLIGHLHHIATDGWSISLLFEDLERVYHALEQGLDPASLEPAAQYEAFAARQRQYMAGDGVEAARNHWRSVYRGAGAATVPPAAMSPGESGESSRYVNVLLGPERAAAVRAYAQRQRITVYNTLLSAFAQFLAGLTGDDEVLIGTSTAGRQGGTDDRCLGLFISPMPLRLTLSPDGPVEDLHSLVAGRMRDFAEHRMYPMADLVESVEPFIGRKLPELYAVHFIYQNQPQPRSGPGRSYRQIDFQDAGLARPFDLPMPPSRVLKTLEAIIFDRPDGSLSINFAFDPARLHEVEVTGWLDAYAATVDQLIRDEADVCG